MIFFVENLNLRVLFFTLWQLVRCKGDVSVYVVDATKLGILGTRLWAILKGVSVQRFDFRIVEMCDKSGLQLRLRLAFKDLIKVQCDAIQAIDFAPFNSRDQRFPRLPDFLAKNVSDIGSNRDTVWRALLLVIAARHKVDSMVSHAEQPVLILEKRVWLDAICAYAKQCGVRIETVRPAICSHLIVSCIMNPFGVALLRMMREVVFTFRMVPNLVLRGRSPFRVYASTTFPRNRPRCGNARFRLGVEFSGRMNLDRPEYYSDLFFWQSSGLSGKDIILTSKLPQDPFDDSKTDELRRHDISAIALNSGATKVSEVPVFLHYPSLHRPVTDSLFDGSRSAESKWLKQQVAQYWVERNYWTDLFLAERIKTYVTWNRFDASHIPLADAIESVGGISAIYQRAFQRDPSPIIAVSADLMFGYAPDDAEIERRSGSTVPFHVSVGYFGDHRAPLLRNRARVIREQLRNHGAEYIMAYFDEGTADDGRWDVDHEFMRVNYVFLLEKVLSEPWFGLGIKSKIPSTLVRRLGPVSELLKRAIATGRCYLYDAGQPLFGSRPPVEAALAADVAVHERLSSGTAGLEAALAGIPTLLLDREGWGQSLLYELGEGRVVFKDLESLWVEVKRHRLDGMGGMDFGDWKPLLNEIDPFRDGLAAQRMGMYLKWILDGFAAEKSRKTILAEAAERYCAQWGADKVQQVNCNERTKFVGLEWQNQTLPPVTMAEDGSGSVKEEQ